MPEAAERSRRKMKHTMLGVICRFKIDRAIIVGKLVPVDDMQHKYEEWYAEDDALRPGNDGMHCGEGRTTRVVEEVAKTGGGYLQNCRRAR